MVYKILSYGSEIYITTATIIKMLGNEFGISYEAGALAATLIFIIYTAASGLFGVVYTDVLQFFMLIIFV